MDLGGGLHLLPCQARFWLRRLRGFRETWHRRVCIAEMRSSKQVRGDFHAFSIHFLASKPLQGPKMAEEP